MTNKVNEKLTKIRASYWGRVPNVYEAHSNISFKRFGRRSNWNAASSLLALKSGACAKTLFFSLFVRTVESNRDVFNDLPHIMVNWSERHIDAKENSLIAEHGWLPRTSYQVSPSGANARSHTCFKSNIDYVAQLGEAELASCKRRAVHFLRPKNIDLGSLTSEPFCLLPLQGGNDYNLKFSDSGFDHIFGKEKANDLLAEAVIERCHAEAGGVRVIVTEHPAKTCRLSKTPKLPDGVTFVGASQGIRSIDLAAHENCLGVVSVNSNLIHEAMLLDKHVCAYGQLMYRSDDKPVYSTIGDMLEGQEYEDKLVAQYLSLLFLNQWEVGDLMDPVILHALLSMELDDYPWKVRQQV